LIDLRNGWEGWFHAIMTYERPNGSEEAYLLMIEQQRRTIATLELPVLQLWEGILALPLVGSLDDFRVQRLNEILLQRIVETGSEVVILDIGGVPAVDVAVARRLLEVTSAARLLGAEVIVVGLSTRTALAMVHLGIDLASVTTRKTMAQGLALGFDRLGLRVAARRALPNGAIRVVDHAD
jgi:rsbT co-antagonist protein RsbR